MVSIWLYDVHPSLSCIVVVVVWMRGWVRARGAWACHHHHQHITNNIVFMSYSFGLNMGAWWWNVVELLVGAYVWMRGMRVYEGVHMFVPSSTSSQPPPTHHQQHQQHVHHHWFECGCMMFIRHWERCMHVCVVWVDECLLVVLACAYIIIITSAIALSCCSPTLLLIWQYNNQHPSSTNSHRQWCTHLL